MKRKTAIICDFDGTMTMKDIGDSILRHFKIANAQEIEKSYSLQTNLEKWMREKFKKLTAKPQEIEKYVLSIVQMRRGASDLIKFCRQNSIPFEIVSGGVDVYAEPILKKLKIKVKSFFGKARYSSDGYVLEYPFLDEKITLAQFKMDRVQSYRRKGMRVIFCGDGTSDLKAAKAADLVYATKKLLKLCKEKKIKCLPLVTFSSLRKSL